MKRTKEGKEHKGKLDGRWRKKSSFSRFEKELKKLECTVNYLGARGEGKVR